MNGRLLGFPSGSSNKYLVGAGKVLMLVCALLLLHACNGGCSRNSTPESGSFGQINPDREDTSEIYAHPVKFDAQTIEEYAITVSTDRELTSAETAMIIVATESAVNRLCQIVEDMDRNDDPADARYVLDELNQTLWVAQTVELVNALQKRQLDSYGNERVVNLRRSLNYIVDKLSDMRKHKYPELPELESAQINIDEK